MRHHMGQCICIIVPGVISRPRFQISLFNMGGRFIGLDRETKMIISVYKITVDKIEQTFYIMNYERMFGGEKRRILKWEKQC